MKTARVHLCKDCRVDPPATVRKLAVKKDGTPYPGPRCTTHHRQFSSASRSKAKAGVDRRQFSITPQQRERMYLQQGGRCFYCRRASGASKHLAIDHDHACCPGPVSCGLCVRGLLCGPCNQEVGRVRDEWEAFLRMANYLRFPPALWMLARKRTPDGGWDWAYDLGEQPERGHEADELAQIAAFNSIPLPRQGDRP